MSPQRRRRTRKFFLGAGGCLGGYVALSVAVAMQPRPPLDLDARAWTQPLRHDRLELPMQMVSSLGDATGLVPIILLASLALWRFRRGWAVLLPFVMAGTGALQYLAKWAAQRPRPNEAPWGFPSGHTLSVAVLAGLLLYLLLTAIARHRRGRWLACAGATAPVAMVAWSRIYLDMHWLSDVIGGLAIGAAYLLLVVGLAELAKGRGGRSSSRDRRGDVAGTGTYNHPDADFRELVRLP